MTRNVTSFESSLIRITRALVGRLAVAEVLPLLVRRVEAPRCLSRQCIALVEDTLSKGMTERLARLGWQSERTQQGESIVSGRLWERTPLAARSLTFSPQLLKWLIWLTADNFADPRSIPKLKPDAVLLGDRIFWWQSFLVLNETLGISALAGQRWFRNHGLIALAFPDTWAEQRIPGEPDVLEWVQPGRAWVTEAYTSVMVKRWIHIEEAKRQSADLEFIRQVSRAQQRILDAFFAAVGQAGRWDLTRWLLIVTRKLLHEVPIDSDYFVRLRTSGLRMAERTMLYEQGLVLFRSIERLGEHQSASQLIGFYDEDYQASQLWKSDWEHLQGAEISRRSQELMTRHLPFSLTNSTT